MIAHDEAVGHSVVAMPQNDAGGKPHLVSLRGPLLVAYADNIRRELLRAVENHNKVLVDCALATDADLSIVQMLISAERTATAAGKSIRVERMSPAVAQAFESGGFTTAALMGA